MTRRAVPATSANELFAAATSAIDASSFETLISAMEKVFADIGFAYFSIVEAVRDGDGFFLRPLLGKQDEAWAEFYQERGLGRADLRMRHAARTPGPFFCSEVLRDESDVTPEERRLFELARPFGIHESYVLPHIRADRRVFAAVLSGVGRPIDAPLRVAANLLSSTLLLAACRLEAQSNAMTAGSAPPLLRSRQLECLEWSRRGKSSADTGKILGLSPRTVDEHVAAACKALGVRTRVQAVSQALAIGLLPHESASSGRGAGNP